jgi:hypothetical protein
MAVSIMRIKRHFTVAALYGAFLLLAMAIPASADLLTNGSFEQPTVSSNSTCGAYGPASCLHTWGPNSQLPGWFVIGKSDINPDNSPNLNAPAPVMLMTNAYQEPYGNTDSTLFFHVQDGSQALDLTGEGNQGENGVKQTVSLTSGQYLLSFLVGHQDSSAPGYTAGPASISLWINGSEVDIFNNDLNTSHDVSWEQFSYKFNASGDTTIAFLNETSLGNNYAGLDDVSLQRVPEPASILLVATGLVGVITRRQRAK